MTHMRSAHEGNAFRGCRKLKALDLKSFIILRFRRGGMQVYSGVSSIISSCSTIVDQPEASSISFVLPALVDLGGSLARPRSSRGYFYARLRRLACCGAEPVYLSFLQPATRP